MTADAMVRSNISNGPQGAGWDAQDMALSDSMSEALNSIARGYVQRHSVADRWVLALEARGLVAFKRNAKTGQPRRSTLATTPAGEAALDEEIG